MKENKHQLESRSDEIENLDNIDTNFDSTPTDQTFTNIPKQKKSRKKIIIIVVVVVLVLIAVASSVWYFGFYNKNQTNNNSEKSKDTTTKKVEVVLNTETDPQVIKFITPTTGEVWLDEPIAIEKQGFFEVKDASYNAGETVTDYFKVGTHGENTIILTSSPGFMSYGYALFEQSPDGTVTLINHPDSLAVYNKDYDSGSSYYVNSNIAVSNDIHYDSLSIPDQIKIDEKGSVVLSPTYPSLGFEYSSPTANDSDSAKETFVRQ